MKRILIFIFILFLSSCVSEIRKPSPPKDLIPERKMIEITKDLVLIEGHVDVTYKMINKYHKIVDASTDAMFKKHHVTKERYTRSFDFYAADQGKLKAIYSAVLDELTLEKGELNSLTR